MLTDSNECVPCMVIYLNQALCLMKKYVCDNALWCAVDIIIISNVLEELVPVFICYLPIFTLAKDCPMIPLPWPPCRQNHHHVHSPHGRGRPPWRPYCHHLPGKTLLLRHATLPEELLWQGLLLDLGSQDEKHPESKKWLWGTCLPGKEPILGEREHRAGGGHSRHFYPLEP